MSYKHLISACIFSSLCLGQVNAVLAEDKLPPSNASTGQQSELSVDNDNLWQRLLRNISLAWDSPNQELYIPLNTWHNRWTYDDDKIESYNERPWASATASIAMMRTTTGTQYMRWRLWTHTMKLSRL
ncbi:palmitoyl transferase [Yersinia enterocolitica]|nr:palmitoyl transferase [Yersinia enterocolitica]